jgi:hypothetical protein
VLTIRAVEIESSEVRLFKTYLVKPDASMEAMLVQTQRTERPQWLDFPPEYGRKKYENLDAAGVSAWCYDVGQSSRFTTEQRARTRARENLQQTIASNIASNYSANIDVYELSAECESDIGDVQLIVKTAISNSIKLRLPSFEALEWYIERGTEEGKQWYMANVLVRYPRQDMLKMIEQINPGPIAQEIMRKLPAAPLNFQAGLLNDLTEARNALIK